MDVDKFFGVDARKLDPELCDLLMGGDYSLDPHAFDEARGAYREVLSGKRPKKLPDNFGAYVKYLSQSEEERLRLEIES